MFPVGGLAPVAQRQLAAWETIARALPLEMITETHARCGLPGCGQSVIPVDFDGHAYVYTQAEELALKVAHLRQAHMELDPDR